MPVSLKSDHESPIVMIWSKSSMMRLMSSSGEEKASSSSVYVRTSPCETQDDVIRKQASQHLLLRLPSLLNRGSWISFCSLSCTVYGGFITVSHTDKNKSLIHALSVPHASATARFPRQMVGQHGLNCSALLPRLHLRSKRHTQFYLSSPVQDLPLSSK